MSLPALQGEPPGHEQDAGQGGLHYDEESHLCHAGIVWILKQKDSDSQQLQGQLAMSALTPEITGSPTLLGRPFWGIHWEVHRKI